MNPWIGWNLDLTMFWVTRYWSNVDNSYVVSYGLSNDVLIIVNGYLVCVILMYLRWINLVHWLL